MKFTHFLVFIVASVMAIYMNFIPSFAVEVGIDTPPNPTNISYDDRLSYIYGSAAYDGSNYYASYVATNFEVSYYGSFVNKDGVNKLLRTYAYIPTSNTGYLWQIFTVNYLNTGNFANVAWGSVRDSSYQYQSTIVIDGVTYVIMSTNVLLPNNIDLSTLEYYNDSVQLIDGEWSDYSDLQIFNLCKNFDHPAVIGVYDSSIPCFVQGDIAVNQVSTDDIDVSSGQIIGILSPITNKGPFVSSEYYIDCQLLAGYVTTATKPYYQELEYKSFVQTKYNVGFDMSIFNSELLNWTNSTYNPFVAGSRDLKVSCNAVSLNYRLRRKSDGNYGDWYSIGLNNIGINERSYSLEGGQYKPISTGYSGIVSGSVQTIVPTADFDALLTSQAGTSTNISANGVSLGNSSSGGVVQQGGILDLLTATGETNYDNILSYLGDVPKLMAVVFGFLPPFFVSFITTAFLLLVTVGLVKMLV